MKTGKSITGLYNKINIDYSEQADTERKYPPVCCVIYFVGIYRQRKILCVRIISRTFRSVLRTINENYMKNVILNPDEN